MTRITRSSAAIATATALGILAPTTSQAASTTALPAPGELPQGLGTISAKPITMTYQVRTGDTVSEIALRTGTSVSSIVKANSLNSRATIYPGQKLTIPSARTTTASATTSTKPKPAPAKKTAQTPSRPKSKVHVVKSGETLGSIAAKYSSSVSQLASLNSLSNPNRIYVGQKIKLTTAATTAAPSAKSQKPSRQPAPVKTVGVTYVVKPGDTLGAIARAHSTSVASISRENGLSNPNRLAVGQKLTIGGKSQSAPTNSTPKPAPQRTEAARASSTTQVTVYTVQRGDTLSGISAKTGAPIDEITASNGIKNANAIWVGQKLTIGGKVTVKSTPRPALVENNFPGYTYSEVTINAANENKYALVDRTVPSRAEVQEMVRSTAISMGVDPRLALAHAYVESGFDATAVSPANAIGVMQVIPSSGEWASQLVGRKLDLLNTQDNIVAGIAIIRSLHNSASSFDNAIGGYYQGLGGVQKYGMRTDTINYVSKVKNAMTRF